ncbi:bacteriochlorophyll 4-vinyl reductase [Pradoshia sp. D12]|uniref:bacteriochlorophyll 4-vinyl reductase n=1 Tax=Bacillaceae TaxID=186817 RepID=UPI00112D1F4E|nr:MULTISPECIES: bacteriochlorophyll 4-vinyl reductase [Bacillaceae]QFK70375.1 bacteriochlorophyll 4-vinyl reductase [Pradoshia sp. D12]TPF70484.1 bacteriochlorophyll 4-vinyl reductase [Bacillus sp. D12]
MTNLTEGNDKFRSIIIDALKMPGVKVDRVEFLTNLFSEKVDSKQLSLILEKGPVKAGIPITKLDTMAKRLVNKRKLESASISAIAGFPGGLAIATTIPADTLQFYALNLRLAQELRYLFGYKDLWSDNELDTELVQGELIIYIGVMFGVSGASSAMKVLSSKIAEQIMKKLPRKALTKTFYYPIIKKSAQMIGVKITKDTFAKGVAKGVPILGGIVAGTITWTTIKTMGIRLKNALYDSVVDYSVNDWKKDLDEVKKEMQDIIDADFIELEKDIIDEFNEDKEHIYQ